MDCVLKDLISVSKDGEWGKGESFGDSIEMLAIRGTDFENVRFGFTGGVPRRHAIGGRPAADGVAALCMRGA